MALRTHVAVGIVVVALLAAACGSDANDAAGGGVDDGGIAPQTGATGAAGAGDQPGAGSSYTTGSTGESGSASATGPSGAGADVTVSVNNYLFDPDIVEASSGDVLAVSNDNAKTPHTFTVVGEDVDLQLGPQETVTVTITLAPGTYDVICRFHETLGMTGTLVVT